MVDYRWDLGPLELKPGTQVTFYATATDYLPQTGKSDPRSLTVITAEELQDRIAGREKLIMSELERALRIERGCRAQIESLLARLAQPPRLGQAEVDQLQAVEHNQREAGQVLTSRGEGVPMHVLALLADLENNRLQGDDIRRRVAALLAEIDRLGREHLPAIGRELTAAVKTAQVELEGQGGARRCRPADRRIACRRRETPRRRDRLAGGADGPTGPLGQLSPLSRARSASCSASRRTWRGVRRRWAAAPWRKNCATSRRKTSPICGCWPVASSNWPGCWTASCRKWTRPAANCGRTIPRPPKRSPTPWTRPAAWPSAGRCAPAASRSSRTRSARRPPGRNRSSATCRKCSTCWPSRQTGKSNTAAASPSESGTSRTPSGAGQPKPGSADGQTPGDRSAASASPRPAGDGKDRKLDRDELRAVDQAALGPIAGARPRANAAIARRGVPAQVRSADRRVFSETVGGEGRWEMMKDEGRRMKDER